MRPFYVTLTNVIHGLITVLALIVVADVVSPTFNIMGIPDWTGSQATLMLTVIVTASLALGIVMHTISRSLFHKAKQAWTLEILTSGAVQSRLAAVNERRSVPGGPTSEELESEDTRANIVRAATFMHGVEYQVMVYAPEMYQAIQMYRDQYRLARGFVVPAAILAFFLPFWDPVAALDGAGAIGPFPIIRSQVFLVSILASAVTFVAFRERAYRYEAAKAMAWVTLEGMGDEEREEERLRGG